MSTTSDRVVCARCGANNFITQAACWKCGNSPVTAAPAPAPPAASREYGNAVSGNPPGFMPSPAAGYAAPPPSSVNSALRVPSAPVTPPADPSVASWSAAVLGVLFPVFAVPVGIVFLMLDDRRRIEVGRITIIWGIIGTILQFIVTGFLVNEAMGQVKGLVPLLQKRGQTTAAPTEDAPPVQFPSP